MTKRIQHDIGDNYIVGVKHASYKALDFIDDTTKNLSNLFGLPVKVMTPFQVMAINFRLKGYETIIMDMKGQDVIMDEIHTYSGKNMTCIIELIQVLKHIGCRIHICTATMPSVLKNEIIEILATPKQIRFLEGKGFKQVGTWKFDDANKMISAIADNRWFVPKGINAATYKPGQSNKPNAQQLKMNI